jgi:hypothetical protein
VDGRTGKAVNPANQSVLQERGQALTFIISDDDIGLRWPPLATRWRAIGVEAGRQADRVAALMSSRSGRRPGWASARTGQGSSVKLNGHGAGIQTIVTTRAPGRGQSATRNRLNVRAVPRGGACGRWRHASLGAPGRR